MSMPLRSAALLGAVLLLASATLPAQGRITTPLQEFGHNFGDDYFLANYRQISGYWQKLARESNRIVLKNIGRTADGRDQLMAIVTSPENHRKLDRYREISDRLAHAEGLTDDQARALAKEGKAVVWIDGGLHATESLGAQQLGEMVYQMVSRTDEETMRMLDDVIVLFVHANPDGNDLVADWYMRNADPAQRSFSNLPKLYQKYIAHDNNRDFFASTQAETENMNRVLYREWYPQLLYNHHQSGPAGTVLYSPPLRDPFNYNEDPLVVLGIEQVGNALHTRLAAEGKPGATMRSGGSYDGWWNGGLRNTAVFHNTIAILTEMQGHPTPMRISLSLDRQLPNADQAYPIAPQPWHFRQAIDYSVTCNRAILDLASRMKENVLYNRYVMGKRSIERGGTDTWTPRPHRFAAARQTAGAGGEAALWAALHKPEDRDPRAFIMPASQADFPTATKFVNALLETGITVHRATRDFAVQGKTYPARSYVVFAAQAFRPHVMDMFEPQDHPDNFAYPGAAPTRPYDNAGWTLAFQMGVEFDRILEPFGIGGPALSGVEGFERIPDWNISPPAGAVRGGARPTGYTFSRHVLDSFLAINRLLAAGEDVSSMKSGGFYVAAKPTTVARLQTIAATRGISFDGVAAAPAAPSTLTKLSAPRVGLWDQYGGSTEAGWARWILEQFEFPFTRVFAPDLDAGGLNATYDTLIFVNGGIPATVNGGIPATVNGGIPAGGAGRRGAGGRGAGAATPLNVPAEYRNQIGSVSVDRTLPQIRAFLDNGGTVIAMDSAALNLARYLDLDLQNHLLENGVPLPATKFFTPGSVLQARVDTTRPLAYGMNPHTDVFFDNSQVWTLGPNAAAQGLQRIMWFDSKTPLRSGWSWGQAYLENGVIAADAPVGKGRVVLLGAEMLWRGQPHGTFALVFNGIYSR